MTTDADASWFIRRTREVLGVVDVTLTDAAGTVRAGERPLAPGWLQAPVQTTRDGPLGTLHVLPGPGWSPDESELALAVTASTAVPLLQAHSVALSDRSEIEAAIALQVIALNATDYATMLNGIAAAVAPVIDTTRVGIAVWNQSRGYLQSLPRSFGSSDAMAASSQIEPNDPGSGAARVLRTGRTVWSNDPRRDLSAQRDWIEAFGIRQLLSTPLRIGGHVVGVLHLANHRYGFDSSVGATAEGIAPFVASCVATVQSRTELRRNQAISDAVARTVTAIALNQRLDQVAHHAFPEFCRTADVRRLVVGFVQDVAPRVLVRHDDHGGAFRDDVEEAFLAEASRHETVQRTLLHRPAGAGDAGSSAMHLPIIAAGTQQGTLSVLRVPGDPFSAQEVAKLRRLANVVALAVITERYEQERARRERMQERYRIADELHDNVAQALFASGVVLQSVLEDLAPDSAALESVSRARDLLSRGEASLRDAIYQLSTSDGPIDLISRLRGSVLDIEHEFGIPVLLSVSPAAAVRAQLLPEAASRTTVRAVRELIVNAAKHAEASRIDVVLRMQGQRLLVAVEDDGAGFAPGEPEGYGLRSTRRNLQEVRGTLRIARRSPARGGGQRACPCTLSAPAPFVTQDSAGRHGPSAPHVRNGARPSVDHRCCGTRPRAATPAAGAHTASALSQKHAQSAKIQRPTDPQLTTNKTPRRRLAVAKRSRRRPTLRA